MRFFILNIGFVAVHIKKPNIFLRLMAKLCGLKVEQIDANPFGVYVDTSSEPWGIKEHERPD